MASRPSRASARRAVDHGASAAESRIFLAAGVIGVLVVAIIAVGVVLTVIMPPRATVLTVGDRSFTARAAADRAIFAAVSEGNRAVLNNPGLVVTDILPREETLRREVPGLAGDVTDDDIKSIIRTRVGINADASEQEYADQYAAFLRKSPVDRDVVEGTIRVAALTTKATDHFKSALPEKGPQIQLEGVGDTDKARLQAMRDAVAAGKSLGDEAVARGLTPDAASVQLGWYDPDSAPEKVRDAAKSLRAGQVSDLIPDANGVTYYLIRAVAREEQRTYEDNVKTQIANRQFEEWLKGRLAAVTVTPDLSEGERAWITSQLNDAVRKAVRASGQTGQTGQAGQTRQAG